MNKVVLLGRMAKDVELKTLENKDNLRICNFTIAVNRAYSKNENEQKADFINCVCFGKRAETISKYFKKGDRIAVSGQIQVNVYTDEADKNKYATNILVDDFTFCENKKENNNNNTQNNTYSNTQFELNLDFDDEEIPW